MEGALQQHVKELRGKLLRVLSEELAVDKFITLIGKVHIMIFNELIAVKHIHTYIHTLIGTQNHLTSMYTIKGSDSTKCRR